MRKRFYKRIALCLCLAALVSGCGGSVQEAFEGKRKIVQGERSDCVNVHGNYSFDGERGLAQAFGKCGDYSYSDFFSCCTSKEAMKHTGCRNCLEKPGRLSMSGLVNPGPFIHINGELEIDDDGVVSISHQDIRRSHSTITYRLGQVLKPE